METGKLQMSNGRYEEQNEGDGLYHCTKNTAIPIEDVISRMMEYYNSTRKPELMGMYDYLRRKFHISSFNRNNLVDLASKFFFIGKYGALTLLDESQIMEPVKHPDSDDASQELFSTISMLFNDGVFDDVKSTGIRTYINEIIKMNGAINSDDESVDIEKFEKMEIIISSFIDSLRIDDPQERYNSFLQKCAYRRLNYPKLVNLRKIVNNIHHKNLGFPIQYFVSNATYENLKVLGVETFKDLKSKWSIACLECISMELISFTKILNLFEDEYSKVAQHLFLGMITKGSPNDRTVDVLTQRRNKVTLETLGNFYGIQRERIRQIEAKALRKLESSINTKDGRIVVGIIKCKCKSAFAVTYDEFGDIFGSLRDAAIFGLSHINSTEIFCYHKLELFNLTQADWLSQVESIIADQDSTLTETQVRKLVLQISRELSLTGEIVDSKHIYKVFELSYRKQGTLYSRSNMNLNDRYIHIVKNHFPNGIYIYQDEDINRLKEIYVKEFNDDSIIEKTTRTIGTVLARNMVLVDRGKYNLKERVPSLTKELGDAIANFVDNLGTVILFTSIFAQFRKQFKSVGISNRYMLQSLIKQYFGDKYYYRKDALSKDVNNFSITGEIENYIESLPGFFTVDQIDRKFPSVMSGLATRILFTDPNYIPAYNKKWISGNRISVTDDERDGIAKIMMSLLENKTFITTKDVLEATRLKFDGFYTRNKIDNRFFLFGVLKYLYQDELEFARPCISKEEIEVSSSEERVRSFLSDRDLITIEELKDALEMLDARLYSLSQFISDISQDFLRIDESTLVSKSSLQITEDDITKVDEILGLILRDKKGINTKNVNLTFFPKIKQPFNKYYLASFVESCSVKFRIIRTTNFYNTTEFIIVRANLNIKNYEEYLNLLNKEGK